MEKLLTLIKTVLDFEAKVCFNRRGLLYKIYRKCLDFDGFSDFFKKKTEDIFAYYFDILWNTIRKYDSTAIICVTFKVMGRSICMIGTFRVPELPKSHI